MSTNNSGSKTSEVVFEYKGEAYGTVPKDITHVRFNSSVTKVEGGAFHSCSNLREVVLNEGLQTIGLEAFWECTSLESITLPSTMSDINHTAFYGCSSLRGVVFNKGLKKMGHNVFIRCTALQSITLPSTLTEIPTESFRDCHNLEKVVLNEGLKKIGIYAFRGCSSLQSITLPSTLVEIDQQAFGECPRLKKVAILDGIKVVTENAFDGCLELDRLNFPGHSTRLNNIINAGQTEIRNKIDDVLIRGPGRARVELRDGEMFILRSALAHWRSIRKILRRTDKLITYYEIREATTLFELALWKAWIDQAEEATDTDINREAYSIEVPGPVKDTILQYIGKSLL